VVYPVVNEALETESWRYNHNISIGGNAYHKPIWKLKASSHNPRLLIDRLVTCHEEILILAILKATSGTTFYLHLFAVYLKTS
jgi:hypothetical protein